MEGCSEEDIMSIRQPIVSVLGHVDHGKTKLLDTIRGTSVVAREAGLITQHIGATEVPIDHIYDICSVLIGKTKFDVPGLLFIDTPGHHSFTTLRARGGSLADLAVLVIDVKEGIKPQTIESIKILKRFKTPFLIALNKVDLIPGWQSKKDRPFILSEKQQRPEVAQELNMRLYEAVAALAEEGLSAERYDRIENFKRNIAMVPCSAKTGEGIPDLLLVLIGLAQRFLEDQLEREEGPGKGTILEVKEERGLGQTLDVILYSGTLHKGDTVALGTRKVPVVTKIKAILKPKPLDEIRDPRDKFASVKEVGAAAGIKLSCQNLEGVIAGGALRVIEGDEEEIIEEMTKETEVNITVQDEGITIKADAIGSLEALAFEADAANIPIRKYGVGDISRRDVIETAAYGETLNKVILGFNVSMLPEVKDAVAGQEIKVFTNEVVYRLIQDYQEWVEEEKRRTDVEKRAEFAFPAKFRILPNCVFRGSKPAIVGVRVLAGRIRPGQRLISSDGREVGKIRSIRSGEEVQKEAIQGDEVAVAIEGATVGRQIDVEDIIYIDLLGSKAKQLREMDITEDEKMTLDELLAIKRKTEPFWGM
jgi:translation initiation factor 5B